MVQSPVYMDNHATTRVDPRVVESMLPFFHDVYGNPGSVNHVFGWESSASVKEARQSIAQLINATPKEIVFTSGATESNNLAIRGVVERKRRRGGPGGVPGKVKVELSFFDLLEDRDLLPEVVDLRLCEPGDNLEVVLGCIRPVAVPRRAGWARGRGPTVHRHRRLDCR